MPDPPKLAGERCAVVGDVSLHANVAVPARDRPRLERLCRHVARPPLAMARFSRTGEGRLLYRLKHRWRDGTTHVVFEPQELVEKLAALIPPPRFKGARYHGVFAPCARERGRVVPAASVRPVESETAGAREEAAVPISAPANNAPSAAREVPDAERATSVRAEAADAGRAWSHHATRDTAWRRAPEATRVGHAVAASVRDRRARVPALRRAHPRALGVDGITKEEYGQALERNLRDLHARLVVKHYRHQPIRRVYIPKELGKTRPIGISAFEDQRVQDAVREVLEAIYEQDFLDCSYGFRPGRSAHDAVRTLDQIVHRGEGSWILEADIVSFFDSIDRNERRKMLEIRVADGSLLRLIGKCLQVGGLDGAELSAPETGTAQGSVLSPLLGNITLHYALDLWLKWPRRRLVSAACCSLTGRCRWRWHPSVTDWIARRRLARRVLHAIPQQPRRERAQ